MASILEFKNQDILEGSSKINSSKKINRIDHYVKNIKKTKSFYYLSKNKEFKKYSEKHLETFLSDEFLNYRKLWNEQPNNIIQNPIKYFDKKAKFNPLCVDLEVASICDLACPHCFREYVATPDKIINIEFAKQIIDQVVDMKIPSMKFNWRGEPLLFSKLPEVIDYAKSKGVIDTIINTNATNLDEKKSIEIIKSGLDHLIYSFDGGTKETYEKMRPGRFKENKFENVYENIINFKKIKDKLGSPFPFTKIQMVLTEDTRKEIENFYSNFNSFVDEVTVTQYSERGGKISNLSLKVRNQIIDYFEKNDLDMDTPFMVEANGDILVSEKRKPCKQLFQRLMVTYNGKVGMCCVDWGATHNLGYVNEEGFNFRKDENKILDSVSKDKKGFELLKNIKLAKEFNNPKHEVQSLNNIWDGEELNKVRKAHLDINPEKIDICKKCQNKDTYEWKKIN